MTLTNNLVIPSFVRSQYTIHAWIIAYLTDLSGSLTITNGDFTISSGISSVITLSLKFSPLSSAFTTNIVSNVWTFLHLSLDSTSKSIYGYVTNIQGSGSWQKNIQNNSLYVLTGTPCTQITITNVSPYTGLIKSIALYSTYQTLDANNLSFLASYLSPNFNAWSNAAFQSYFDFSTVKDNTIYNLVPYGVSSTITFNGKASF